MKKKIAVPPNFLCICLATLVFLSSCTGAVSPGLTTFISSPTLNITSAATSRQLIASTEIPTSVPTIQPQPVSTPNSQPSIVRPLYTLDSSLNYGTHSLAVDETIIYQNQTGIKLPNLVLAVEPNLWAGCFILEGALINGQDAGKMTLVADRLDVLLAAPLDPGASLTMSLQFDLHLPPADIHHVFGFSSRQENFVDWYPFIVPYSGGWILHPPGDVGEHLVYDVADFNVTITRSDQSKPVEIAASAPAEMSPGVWHYILQNARDFVFSASTSFLTSSITTGGMTITNYYFPGDDIPAGAVLDATVNALKIYRETFGPTLQPGLNIVETPFFDGMEYDGLYFISQDYYASYHGKLLGNLVDIAVHETAHQWWFAMVGNDQAMEPWLDEALATYSEEIFYEKNIPRISDWWIFRVESFSPAGWVDSNIYDGFNFRTYTNAVYLRGAQFLDALRKKIGDPAFFSFLKDYASQMAGKLSASEDFFRILGTHTNANITDLVSLYFQHSH